MKEKKTKKVVRDHYGKIANQNRRCCSTPCNGLADSTQISKEIGYSEEELQTIPDANLGLGCGNPTAISAIKDGDVVLDLGSGAGFDCFLASKKVGTSGKVIGIDMTKEMIAKATDNASRYGYKNVEFRFGDIEKLPVENDSVDIIISNCVINLAPDKLKVFQEAYRVLKNEGSMYLSDIVLLEELSDEQRNDEELIAGCVGGAVLKEEYLKIINEAKLKYTILFENKAISKTQYKGINLESITLKAYK